MTQRTHLAVPVSERDHHQGPATAAVTLVQYGDYECPYTRLSTTNARSPASRRMWKVVNAAEYKALPRSSSMEPCIAVPGNRMPCFLHSRQRAEHRDAHEVGSQ